MLEEWCTVSIYAQYHLMILWKKEINVEKTILKFNFYLSYLQQKAATAIR